MARRKSFFDEIEKMLERFKRLFEEQEETYGLNGLRRCSSTMYFMTVTYDHYGRPVVRVSTQGDVGVSEIEKYVKERYPSAKIIWESEDDGSSIKPLSVEDNHVREVSIQEHSDLKQARRLRGTDIIELNSNKPRIYEVEIEDESKNKKSRGWYDIKVD